MNDRRLTPQQQEAVDTRGVSVVLSSGAGCGKTSVLTDRYLSHLERDGCEVTQLAAITFTDKAAREMRRRIRSAIRTKIANGERLDEWRRHLRNLESATISTIHAFCGQLLRRFALLAGLDPTFEIMEESIAPNLRDNVVQETLYGLVVSDESAGGSLKELVRYYGWSRVRKTIDRLVLQRDTSGWQKWLALSPAEISSQWQSYGQSIFNDTLETASASGPVAQLFARLPTIEIPHQKFADTVATINAEWNSLPKTRHPLPVLANLREAAKVQGIVKKSDWPDPSIFPQVRDGFAALRKLVDDQLIPLCVPDKLDSVAEFGQHFLRVAAACVTNYQAEKNRRGYVDFQDLLVLARNLLRDNVDARRQCQATYRFVLVDELQDTDHVQMELLDYLCGATGKTKGKLFAVGDAKQSIYRFRGAEVEEFVTLRECMPAQGRQSLTYNFRSQPRILHFVNALLRDDMPDYEPLQAMIPQVNPGPCVELLRTDAVPKNVTLSRQNEARRIAQAITAMIDNQEQLVAEKSGANNWQTRAVQPKDVVLLFRAMTNVSLYEEALRSVGLDYYLVGGRAFFAQQEIYDVLNLLRVLENPHDLLSLAGVLRSPFGCISDDGLYLLSRHPKGLWKAIHDSAVHSNLPAIDRGPAERIGRWLLQWRQLKDRLPMAGLLNQVLADSGYDAALRYENLAERKLANLWKLIDLARTFDSVSGFILADFVHRLDELVAVPPREEQAATQPEESNVIRIMSIHQAKGLEFPVVFVPDINAKANQPFISGAEWDDELGCIPNPPSDEDPPAFDKWPSKLWVDREKKAEYAEALRVFYVACTRAKDYLVLSGSFDAENKVENPASKLLKERFDLRTGQFQRPFEEVECPTIRVDRSIPAGESPRRNIQIIRPAPLTAADARRAQPIGT